MKQMACLFLGTGASMGIPHIGCHCRVCSSTNSKNHRLRSSVLLTVNQKKILVDCGPDYRQQALKYRIDTLDGFMLTHAHHDHTASLDELRAYRFCSCDSMPCLLSRDTLKDIQLRFSYMFATNMHSKRCVSKFNTLVLPDEAGEIEFCGVRVVYFSFMHADIMVNGFRVGSWAYITDISTYRENIFDYLKGVETLVISALQFAPSPLHFSVDEAIDFSRRVGARQTWLTHIGHEMEHEHANAYLPENIRVAYDGLELTMRG